MSLHQEISGRQRVPSLPQPGLPVCWVWRTAGAWSLTKEGNFRGLTRRALYTLFLRQAVQQRDKAGPQAWGCGFHLKALLFTVKYLEKHSSDLFWDPDKNLSCASEAPHDFKCASSQSAPVVLWDHSGVLSPLPSCEGAPYLHLKEHVRKCPLSLSVLFTVCSLQTLVSISFAPV